MKILGLVLSALCIPLAYGEEVGLAVSATQTGSGMITPGNGRGTPTAQYRVVVQNTSPDVDAEATSVNFTLPKQLNITWLPYFCTESRGHVTCQTGDIAPGQSFWINLDFTSKQSRPCVLTFYATAVNATQVATSATVVMQ